jgi:hypothetical protein
MTVIMSANGCERVMAAYNWQGNLFNRHARSLFRWMKGLGPWQSGSTRLSGMLQSVINRHDGDCKGENCYLVSCC